MSRKTSLVIAALLTVLFAAFACGIFLSSRGRHGTFTVSTARSQPSAAAAPAKETAPPPEEPAQEISGQEEEETVSFPLDLNTASEKELEAIPGLSASDAKLIVSFRETYGAYYSVDDIAHVGISRETFLAVYDYLCVG